MRTLRDTVSTEIILYLTLCLSCCPFLEVSLADAALALGDRGSEQDRTPAVLLYRLPQPLTGSHLGPTHNAEVTFLGLEG
jgi:hypothetical protein